MSDNNKAFIRGRICEEITFDHECKEIKFYSTKVVVPRLNKENQDYIPIIIPEQLVQGLRDGKFVEIQGEARMYRKLDEDGVSSHLEIFVFVQEVEILCKTEEVFLLNYSYLNKIELKAFVCKEIVLRQTPRGITLADFIAAVNRSMNGKADYLPCIAWWEEAERIASLNVSDQFQLEGRFQSRYVPKKEKDVYEISASQIIIC